MDADSAPLLAASAALGLLGVAALGVAAGRRRQDAELRAEVDGGCDGCDAADECASDILGTATAYHCHVLVATGVASDGLWNEKIEKVEGSFAQVLVGALKDLGMIAEKKKKDQEKAALGAGSDPTPKPKPTASPSPSLSPDAPAVPFAVKVTAVAEDATGGRNVLLYTNRYPRGVRIRVEQTAAGAQGLCEALLRSRDEGDALAPFQPEPLPWDKLILVCTHASRDKRCGRAGPQMLTHMSEALVKRGLGAGLPPDHPRHTHDPRGFLGAVASEISHRLAYGAPRPRVVLRGCSHIGGHKHAGVCIVYPEADWYGRISKANAAKLLARILSEEKLLPQLRGASRLKAPKT